MAASSKQVVDEIYSDALFQLASESGQVEQVLGDLASVSSSLNQEPDFLKLLVSATLKDTEKAAIVSRVFNGRVCDLMLDFLCVLSRRNRVGFLSGITARYGELSDGLKNCRLVEVTVAKRLSGEDLEKLRLQIGDAISAEVKLKVNLDPGILGGIVIRQGDLMVDNSVRTVLGRMVSTVMDRSKETMHKQISNADENKQ